MRPRLSLAWRPARWLSSGELVEYAMGEITFLEVASRGIQTALYMAAPVLILSLIVGFIISIFQAVTSIQEQTLTFVPKIFITGLALVVFGPWMHRVMTDYAISVFGHLQNFVR